MVIISFSTVVTNSYSVEELCRSTKAQVQVKMYQFMINQFGDLRII